MQNTLKVDGWNLPLWFIPMLYVGATVVCGLVLPRLEQEYLAAYNHSMSVYGVSSVQVMRRLRAALVGLTDTVTEVERKEVVARYLRHLNLVIAHSVLDAEDQVMALQEDRQGLGLSRRRAAP